MDQELITYFDEHFRRTSQQIGDLRGEMTQQISALSEETTRQISALREEMMQQISSLREEMTQRFEQVDRRFERLEEEDRHTQVIVESLHGEIRLLAEGIMGLGERLEAHKNEITRQIKEIEASIAPYYQDLNRRVSLLEGRAERQTRDIIEEIRKRYGQPPPPP
jgi:chromosome segregation ATPase